MAIQHKSKLIETTGSCNVARFMILTSWLSFIVSLWLAMFLSSDFFFLGIFWFILTVILAGVLGAKKKV